MKLTNRTGRVLLLSVALLTVTAQAGGQTSLGKFQEPSPYERAVTWLRKNSKFTSKGMQKMTEDIRQGQREGQDLQLVLGEKLVKSGKPRIVFVRDDRLATFTITPAQARKLQTAPDICSTTRIKRNRDAEGPQLLKLKDVKIEGNRITEANIVGQCDCKVERDPGVKLATHFWVRTPTYSTTITKPLPELPKDGEPLRFSFAGLRRDGDDTYRGPVVAFFSIGVVAGDKYTRYSNVVPLLLERD